MPFADSDGESPQTQRIMTTDAQKTRRTPVISGTSGAAHPSQTEATLAMAAHLVDTVGQSETAQAFVDSVMQRVATESPGTRAVSAVHANVVACEDTGVSRWWMVVVTRPRFALAAVMLVCAVNVVGVWRVVNAPSSFAEPGAAPSASPAPAAALAEYYDIATHVPDVP